MKKCANGDYMQVVFLSLTDAYAFIVACGRDPSPPQQITHIKYPREDLSSKGFSSLSLEATLVFIIFLDLLEQTIL